MPPPVGHRQRIAAQGWTRPSLVCGPPDESREGASGPDPQNEVLPPGTGGGNADNWCAEGLRADRASGDVGGRASQTATSTPQMLPQHSENDYTRPKGRQQRRKLGSGAEGTVELRIAASTGDFVAVKFPKSGHNLWREADVAGYVYRHPHPNVLAPLFYTGTPGTPSSLAFPVQLGNPPTPQSGRACESICKLKPEHVATIAATNL